MEIVIGIDGGGTYTRAIAIDLSGQLLSLSEAGGCNPAHAPDAEQNVQEAIRKVIESTGANLGDVVGLVAGLAGLDSMEDTLRCEKQTAVEGLDCPRVQVNDAVVAHAGALQSQPGIIAISGTGSIVFGINEQGQHLRNYDFRHYAPSAAGHLSRDAIHRLLAGDAQPADAGFVAQVLNFWNVENITDLLERAFRDLPEGSTTRWYHVDSMAKIVTEAAQFGAPLAQAVCTHAAGMMGIGIRLVGSLFTSEEIPVVFIGSAIRSEYMQTAVARALNATSARRFEIVEPAFSPVIGAALMALQNHGVAINAEVLKNLGTSNTLLNQKL